MASKSNSTSNLKPNQPSTPKPTPTSILKPRGFKSNPITISNPIPILIPTSKSTGASPSKPTMNSPPKSNPISTSKSYPALAPKPIPTPISTAASTSTASAASTSEEVAPVRVEDLPLKFEVKYIGSEMAHGLWGIKYTRRPVEALVGVAKQVPPIKEFPQCELTVSRDGVKIQIISPEKDGSNSWEHAIDTISYGVQDLVYTRVFAMIVIKDERNSHPFDVHAFVCSSRAKARKLTFALSAAFREYTRRDREASDNQQPVFDNHTKKYLVDLRTPEERAKAAPTESDA